MTHHVNRKGLVKQGKAWSVMVALNQNEAEALMEVFEQTPQAEAGVSFGAWCKRRVMQDVLTSKEEAV